MVVRSVVIRLDICLLLLLVRILILVLVEELVVQLVLQSDDRLRLVLLLLDVAAETHVLIVFLRAVRHVVVEILVRLVVVVFLGWCLGAHLRVAHNGKERRA